jgi:CobQ-like glutamine amidotransferase family enzyme
MELKICHLYSDVMNLSCDRGNVLVLEKRLQWRGIDVTVTAVNMGDMLEADAFDLIFIGNGQPYTQPMLLEDLKSNKAAALKEAVENGVPVLAIDGGFELLAKSCRLADGTVLEGLGILDAEVRYDQKRLVGDYVFASEELGLNLVGFENHAGKMYLGEGIKPLGKILAGNGNNGSDGTEGARYRNVFASYAHGALLPKNPALADRILKLALERRYREVELADLTDTFEHAAHNYMEQRLLKK